MMLVSSTLQTRIWRLVLLYVAINGLALLTWMAVGTYTLATSEDGTIPGWSGGPVEQVFWYAVGSTFFTTASFGLLVLLAVVLVLAVADKVSGPARSS